jgi:hypothetical protein
MTIPKRRNHLAKSLERPQYRQRVIDSHKKKLRAAEGAAAERLNEAREAADRQRSAPIFPARFDPRVPK